MSAVKKEKEDSEILSLLNAIRGGIPSEAHLAEIFLKHGKRTCPKLGDIIADHIGVLCRGPSARRKGEALNRKMIEKHYPYMEAIRGLPHAELLNKLVDDSQYRVALLIGAIIAGEKVVSPGSEEHRACWEEWRLLFFPHLKTVE